MGFIDQFTKLILLVAYCAYILCGIILLVLTLLYVSEIPGTNNYVVIGLGGSGLVMIFVGATALWATFKDHWLALVLVELLNLALFTAVLAAMIIAFRTSKHRPDRPYCSINSPAQATGIIPNV